MADVNITLGLDDREYQQRIAAAKATLTQLQREATQQAQKRRTEGTRTNSRIRQEEARNLRERATTNAGFERALTSNHGNALSQREQRERGTSKKLMQINDTWRAHQQTTVKSADQVWAEYGQRQAQRVKNDERRGFGAIRREERQTRQLRTELNKRGRVEITAQNTRVNQNSRTNQRILRQEKSTNDRTLKLDRDGFNARIRAQRQFNATIARQQLAASAQQRRVAAAQAGRGGLLSGGIAAAGAGFGVATAGVAGLGLALASGVRRLAQFEQAMSTVRAVTRASGEEFAALRAESQRLGATTRFTATEAAEGMLFLGRAGLEAGEILTATADVLLLAQAGSLGLGRAADIATNILKGFRLEATDLASVVDVLALAANSSNQSVEQLGAAMSFVAPVSQSLGISVEETAAALGVLADAGIQGERGGTGLRRVLLALLDPTAKAREAILGLGLSLEDLNTRELGVAEVFRRFREAGAGIEEFAQIFSTRGAGIANVLAQSSDELSTFTGELDQAGGSAQEVATIMDDNLYGSLRRVASAFESLLLAIGDAGVTTALTETFNGLAGALRFVSGGLDNLVENFRLKQAALEQATAATEQATQREKEYAEALRTTEREDAARRGTRVSGVGPTAAFSRRALDDLARGQIAARAATAADTAATDAQVTAGEQLIALLDKQNDRIKTKIESTEAHIRATAADTVETLRAIPGQGALADRIEASAQAYLDYTAQVKNNADAKNAATQAGQSERRAIRDNIRGLKEQSRAEARVTNARLERLRAEERGNRERTDSIALREQEVAVLQRATAEGLTQHDVQRRLTEVQREHNQALLDRQLLSSQISQTEHEQLTRLNQLDGAYDSLSGGLRQARTATDDLHDSMRQIIADFLDGSLSVDSFLNTLKRLVNQNLAAGIQNTLFGTQTAAGGGGGFSGLLQGGGLIGRGVSGLSNFFGFGNPVSGFQPVNNFALGGGSAVTNSGQGFGVPSGGGGLGGGFAGFGGGLVGGFLGNRAFGPIGGIAGGLAGTAIGGGVAGALGGTGFGAGAAGSLGLGGAGALAAAAGPVAIAVAAAIVGKLIFDLFNQPGRIQLEKEGLADFNDALFPDESFSTFKSKQVIQRITGSPEEYQVAGRAVGAAWAISFGRSATQGTIKRFGNQFLSELLGARSGEQIEAYFDRLLTEFGGVEGIIGDANQATRTDSRKQGNFLLSLEETAEEIDEIRDKLSKYADTSNSTIRELNVLAEAHGKVNEEIISYSDIVAGAIILGTKFAEGVDAQQIASGLLAQRFVDVANGGKSLTTQQDLLATQIANGTLTIEEAVIALNNLRAGAGLAKLSLADFTLDPGQVVQAVELITTSLIDLDAFRESLSQALNQNVLTGVAIDFEAGIKQAIGEALIRGLIASVTALATSGFVEAFISEINSLVTQHVTGNITLEELFTGVDETLVKFGPQIDDLNGKLASTSAVVGRISEQFIEGADAISRIADQASLQFAAEQSNLAQLQERNRLLSLAVQHGRSLADVERRQFEARQRAALTSPTRTRIEVDTLIEEQRRVREENAAYEAQLQMTADAERAAADAAQAAARAAAQAAADAAQAAARAAADAAQAVATARAQAATEISALEERNQLLAEAVEQGRTLADVERDLAESQQRRALAESGLPQAEINEFIDSQRELREENSAYEAQLRLSTELVTLKERNQLLAEAVMQRRTLADVERDLAESQQRRALAESGLPQEEIDEFISSQRELNKENAVYEEQLRRNADAARLLATELLRIQQIETTRIDQLGQVGALSNVQVAERQRERQAGFAVGASFDASPAFGGEETVANLERAYQALDGLVQIEIRLFNARKNAIEQQLQVDITAERERSQVRIDAINEEIEANQTLLQVAQDFASAADQVQSTLNSLVTGPASTLTATEQFSVFARQAAGLREQIAGASAEDQPALIRELAQVLQLQLNTQPFQQGDIRRQRVFSDIVSELEGLERLASAGASDIERIEDALAANEAEIVAETMRVEEAVRDLESAATLAIDTLRESTLDTLYDIWRQQQALDERRNELLGRAGADTPGIPDRPLPAFSGGSPTRPGDRVLGTGPSGTPVTGSDVNPGVFTGPDGQQYFENHLGQRIPIGGTRSTTVVINNNRPSSVAEDRRMARTVVRELERMEE